jgi:hypothetical protein
MILPEYKVIGADGFGTVYENKQGIILKAIRDNLECDTAQIEMDKQKIVFNLFNKLKSQTIENDLVDLINKYVRISQVYTSYNSNLTIGQTKYACYYTMSKLYGIPLKMYYQFNPQLQEKITDYSPDVSIMTQLSFNNELAEGFYGRNYNNPQISRSNPSRGYFLGQESDFLDFLRSEYNFDLSDSELKSMIGFIYGYIYFHGGIIPIDIEITLGYDEKNKRFYVNVLDFGLTIDINKSNLSMSDIRTNPYMKILNKNNLDLLTKRVIEDISLDLYCDLETDEDAIKGWNLASII